MSDLSMSADSLNLAGNPPACQALEGNVQSMSMRHGLEHWTYVPFSASFTLS